MIADYDNQEASRECLEDKKMMKPLQGEPLQI